MTSNDASSKEELNTYLQEENERLKQELAATKQLLRRLEESTAAAPPPTPESRDEQPASARRRKRKSWNAVVGEWILPNQHRQRNDSQEENDELVGGSAVEMAHSDISDTKSPSSSGVLHHRRHYHHHVLLNSESSPVPPMPSLQNSPALTSPLSEKKQPQQEDNPNDDSQNEYDRPFPLKAKLSDIEAQSQQNCSPTNSCDHSQEESLLTFASSSSEEQAQHHQHHALIDQQRDDDDDDECVPREMTFCRSIVDRAGWLVGLLVLQSCSSFILSNNQALLQQHIVLVQFLTMLVGSGGNAGNQASVRVIRGLAIGSIRKSNIRPFLWSEFRMGICLSLILGVVGCIRAAIFLVPLPETLAITSSLLVIVMLSIILGATLPLLMHFVLRIDPAHSSTTIQVLMDILGVTITCAVSTLVLNSHLLGTLLLSSSDDVGDASSSSMVSENNS